MSLSKLIGQSGEVEFNAVVDETINTDSRVTEHPVEEGADVADHVQIKSESIPISGIIVGGDAFKKLDQLKRFQTDRELLTFIGVETAQQVVIENMSRQHITQISDGFNFTLKLRKVRISKLQEIKIAVPAKTVNKTQTKKKTTKGKRQPKKKVPKQPKVAQKTAATAPLGMAGLEGRK